MSALRFSIFMLSIIALSVAISYGATIAALRFQELGSTVNQYAACSQGVARLMEPKDMKGLH